MPKAKDKLSFQSPAYRYAQLMADNCTHQHPKFKFSLFYNDSFCASKPNSLAPVILINRVKRQMVRDTRRVLKYMLYMRGFFTPQCQDLVSCQVRSQVLRYKNQKLVILRKVFSCDCRSVEVSSLREGRSLNKGDGLY